LIAFSQVMPFFFAKYFGEGAALMVRVGTTKRRPSIEASRPLPQNCTIGTRTWASIRAAFADEAAATSPDRLAFLLHDTWPLPAEAAAPRAVFSHGVPVRTVRLAPPGPDAAFSFRVCWQSPDTYRNLDLAGAIAFPGLTLPDLAAGLRNVNDPT